MQTDLLPATLKPVKASTTGDSPPSTSAHADDDGGRLYPPLSDDQLRRIEAVAVCCEFSPGEMLFDHGQKIAPFFVLKSGRVDFIERNPCEDRHFLTLSAPVFLGDISIFTGEPTIAACVARDAVQALRVEHEALHGLVVEHSDIGDIILSAFMARRAWLANHAVGNMQLIGPRDCRLTFRLRQFLDRNQIPFHWNDPDEDEGTRVLLARMGISAEQTPVLIAGAHVYRRPSVEQVASGLNLRPKLEDKPYDLIVVGAGPAGLAAAVYGASEGLRTLVLDSDSPGGQAGTSSKIENYLGFATGISGSDLARQAVLQARKFGAVLSNLSDVVCLDCDSAGRDKDNGNRVKTLTLADGRQVRGRCLVIATGADYRKLEGEGFERFEGNGVYYAAGHPEALLCRKREVAIIGGGNSAGQAAIFMSQCASRVHFIIRGEDLRKSMSDYLVSRIEKADNIEVHTNSRVTAAHGRGRLDAVTLAGQAGETRFPCAALFVMIGAQPRTGWLADRDCVGLCPKGFIPTGAEAQAHASFKGHWSIDRAPYFLETTRPGILAVGDVRAGSIKRVASAVGEGSMAVKYAHEYLSSVR